MTGETQRLELYVLDARELRLWTQDLPALERELHNYPSQHILQRCGFIETRSNGTIWWKR